MSGVSSQLSLENSHAGDKFWGVADFPDLLSAYCLSSQLLPTRTKLSRKLSKKNSVVKSWVGVVAVVVVALQTLKGGFSSVISRGLLEPYKTQRI